MYYEYILLYDCSYTRIHIRTHACTHIHTYICVHMSWFVRICTSLRLEDMGAVDICMRDICMRDMGAVDGTRAIHIYLRMYTHTCISISLYVNMYTHTHLLGRSIRARSIATRASLAGCCNTASAGSGGLVCCSVLQCVAVCCSVLQYVAICWE